jgi:hypothetical protein
MACIVKGCKDKSYRTICEKHWFSLPMGMRRRWWRETAYGKVPATAQLIDDVNQELGASDGEAGSSPESGTAPAA